MKRWVASEPWGRRVSSDRDLREAIREGFRPKREVRLEDGEVTKYVLAYINPRVCSADNGRVLGYDNQHGYHHRHFMGQIEPFEFTSYQELVERFQREVEELWEKEDGK